MSGTDLKTIAASLRNMANDLTLAWSNEEQSGEVIVRLSEYVVLDMIDRLNQIASELEGVRS